MNAFPLLFNFRMYPALRDRAAVRRLLDLDHISRIDRLETALEFFEIGLQLSVRPKSFARHEMLRHFF
jgi:hypothetical protein